MLTHMTTILHVGSLYTNNVSAKLNFHIAVFLYVLHEHIYDKIQVGIHVLIICGIHFYLGE